MTYRKNGRTYRLVKDTDCDLCPFLNIRECPHDGDILICGYSDSFRETLWSKIRNLRRKQDA